mmetsp:Transcript_8856/g.31288  ORF Transcript_8856/g.31288 Transcript_8856/m.31288 type:complete len:325 (+) Transcript_8856:155-1129(+)
MHIGRPSGRRGASELLEPAVVVSSSGVETAGTTVVSSSDVPAGGTDVVSSSDGAAAGTEVVSSSEAEGGASDVVSSSDAGGDATDVVSSSDTGGGATDVVSSSSPSSTDDLVSSAAAAAAGAGGGGGRGLEMRSRWLRQVGQSLPSSPRSSQSARQRPWYGAPQHKAASCGPSSMQIVHAPARLVARSARTEASWLSSRADASIRDCTLSSATTARCTILPIRLASARVASTPSSPRTRLSAATHAARCCADSQRQMENGTPHRCKHQLTIARLRRPLPSEKGWMACTMTPPAHAALAGALSSVRAITARKVATNAAMAAGTLS